MSRFAWLAVACACGLALTATPAFADDPKPAKKEDPAEQLLSVLSEEVAIGDTNVNETPLFELVLRLSKKYNLTFTINEESFKQAGIPNARENKPNVAATTQLRGMTLHQFLDTILESMGATYLIRNGAIEIVPTKHAARVTKAAVSQNEDGGTRLENALVSVVARAQPLDEVLAKVAERYDLTVVLATQAADVKGKSVTVRMLNVPADKALELIALQADLRLVRRGNAFLVTTKDHALELYNEKMDREREKIELQKLREAPAKPPVPPGPPAPPVQPAK